MRYTTCIEIARSRDQVLHLLEGPEHRPKWLRGLVSHEPISGPDGQVGTQSRVVFQSGNRTMECTEIITERTRWVSEHEYRFGSLLRLVAPFMRGMFVKQSRQHMEDFTAFAEQGTDVRESER